MVSAHETKLTKDLDNQKINVTREFDAHIDQVWRAWTESELLDQWWAPKPWKAHTISMNFNVGGRWLYYMEGPDGTRHYSLADYKTITPNESFTGFDAFCDEKGNLNPEMPKTIWKVNFSSIPTGTKVDVEMSFDKVEDLEKTLEMGFEEGFAAAHGNLDELLAKNK